MNKNIDNIWITIVHVKVRKGFEGILNNNIGAFVNILVKAKNIKEAKFLIEKVFFEEGFLIIEIFENKDGGLELLSDRLKTSTVHENILKLIEFISEEYPVQFDDFNAYPK